jgi:hypothetical protein
MRPTSFPSGVLTTQIVLAGFSIDTFLDVNKQFHHRILLAMNATLDPISIVEIGPSSIVTESQINVDGLSKSVLVPSTPICFVLDH